ncbi:hypothetical protein F5Y00DRAFT_204516 [Daldinia vernicosa]|uniref:uncharacterized protein n=1 Tax=Daldinia vernicosa TaxID=114800 RepID=UPI0020078AC6|nr:uncharacterized protein F5Y00DRAFT_204516 [Daldinia vernicosa]KAI0851975.1 hypothetical protein F5Y00DRAFT_204516 [Daldinia vernicosa]
MSSQVPTPRQFLTSLIESLNSIPTPTPTTPQPNTTTGTGNPLKLVPPAHRPLLTTLYALYPLTLLPALDLLDRRLATRIIIAPPSHHQQGGATTTTTPAPAPPQPPEEKGQPPSHHHSFYIVRSAQPQHPRRDTASASAPGPRYVVRLSSWNCSCAAFAFAAFPRGEDRYVINTAPRQPSKDDALEWQFGALSLDGVQGSGIAGVPCCKHLLACVLAERWSAVLGGYVDERVVGREEAAGLVADV